jgi:hypothetical protein
MSSFLMRKPSSSDDFYDDIYDGELYQSFKRSFRTSEFIYSFTINTDGISMSNKSNLSIWPVFLTINELPLEERFCIQNVIVAGNLLFS